MTLHERYHFSVTIKTDYLALVSTFRGLAQHCQDDNQKGISWGGTKEKDWKARFHNVTFHFTSPNYRDSFVSLAQQLAVPEKWQLVDTSDYDPAIPQS